MPMMPQTLQTSQIRPKAALGYPLSSAMLCILTYNTLLWLTKCHKIHTEHCVCLLESNHSKIHEICLYCVLNCQWSTPPVEDELYHLSVSVILPHGGQEDPSCSHAT